jgi:predicted flap endonuclease-1-like 5' DNA nuclease
MTSVPSDRLAAVEQRLALLEGENENLKHQLEQIQHQPVEGFIVGSLSGDDLPSTPVEEDDDDEDNGDKRVEEARDAIRNAIGAQIPLASTDSIDDLIAIEGVGSFLQGKLNELGIYNYDQIAHLDDMLIEQLTTAIEFFPGRIHRDDWVGQAARLHNLKTENPEALTTSNDYPSDSADLKVIEGVGPKIEQILKAAGIQNWEDLAEADIEKMEELLKQAGKDYHMHDPSTWPQQAQLAVNSQWEMLREYQDFLIGGRDQS